MIRFIYNCPSDPRLFVYKSEAYPFLGVTLNFAHRGAYWMLALALATWGGAAVAAVWWRESGHWKTAAAILFLMLVQCFGYYFAAAKERKKYELFAVYDESGRCVGAAERRVCHGRPEYLHRTSHVVVFNRAFDAILLQKRRMDKDIQPGKWDTAVGGHLNLGENYGQAARRELAEELGVKSRVRPVRLFDSRIRNQVESEDTRVFGWVSDGPFEFQKSEIDEVAFFPLADLRDRPNRPEFTPNLVAELATLFRELDAHPELQDRLNRSVSV